MKNTYDFYFRNDDTFVCRYDNKSRVRFYKNEDALRMLHRINRMNFSSFKVTEKKKNNKSKLYLNMNSQNNRVSITNFRKFDDYGLFEQMPHHLKNIEKACEKFSEKRFKNKTSIVKKFVATATALAILSGGASLVLNRDSAVPETNYTMEEEDVRHNEFQDQVVGDDYDDESVIETDGYELDDTYENDYDDYSFESNIDSITYEYVDENYHDLVYEIAEERGLSPELVEGVLTQESAGKLENLMQITYSVWQDHVFNTYNFKTNTKEKYVLSENPSLYDDDVHVYSIEDMNDPYNNINFASLIMRETFRVYDYNIPLGIQGYNYGYGNMNKVFDAYSEDTGMTKEEIINDTDSIEFTNYTGVVDDQGDSEYLNHVMRYVDTDQIVVKRIDESGDIVNVVFDVNRESKDKTL